MFLYVTRLSCFLARHTIATQQDSSANFITISITEHVIQHWPREIVRNDPQNQNASAPFLVLKVTCTSCSGSASDWPVVFTDPKTLPFLEVVFQYQPAQARQKRSLPTCDLPAGIADKLTDPKSECCTFGLTATFAEIGFEGVFPERYHTKFCGGRCKETTTRTYTSALQTAYRKKAARRNLSGTEEKTLQEILPCCLPRKRSDLQIVYSTVNGEQKKSKIKGFIVSECGC